MRLGNKSENKSETELMAFLEVEFVESDARIEQQKINGQIQYFLKIRRYEKAKVLAQDLISRYPNYPNAYYAMSVYENYHGRTDNAIELCHRSMELGMSQLATGILLMLYYDQKSDYSNVDAQFDLLSRNFPSNYDVLAIYGYSMWQRGQKDKGISILNEAFSYNPTDSMVIKFLFTTTKSDKNGALNELLKLYMSSNASDNQKMLLSGIYEFQEHNWQEARKCFASVIAQDPKNDEALHYMEILELRKKMPLIMLSALGFGILVYFFKFNYQQPLTYVFFLPSLLFLVLFAVVLVKMKSI